jgi:hypothetical protein
MPVLRGSFAGRPARPIASKTALHKSPSPGDGRLRLGWRRRPAPLSSGPRLLACMDQPGFLLLSNSSWAVVGVVVVRGLPVALPSRDKEHHPQRRISQFLACHRGRRQYRARFLDATLGRACPSPNPRPSSGVRERGVQERHDGGG